MLVSDSTSPVTLLQRYERIVCVLWPHFMERGTVAPHTGSTSNATDSLSWAGRLRHPAQGHETQRKDSTDA
jgi:hypothetical protein